MIHPARVNQSNQLSRRERQSSGVSENTRCGDRLWWRSALSIIDISSNTTVNETAPKGTAGQGEQKKEKEIECTIEESAPKATSNPVNVAIPVKATTSWQVKISERKDVPPKKILNRLNHEEPGNSARGRRKSSWGKTAQPQLHLNNFSYRC